MMGATGANDSHQNVMPLVLRDGDRGDSYRRTFRWFSNVFLVDGDSPERHQEALEHYRFYVVFHILGDPAGFELYLEADDGSNWEMGSDTPTGTLHVTCPTLAPSSPHGTEEPEISVTVFRNGEVWQTGCGSWPADGPASYRVRVDMVPYHLRPFLGDDPEQWLESYPWIYSNAIRVGFE